jgi:hypothetical protein
MLLACSFRHRQSLQPSKFSRALLTSASEATLDHANVMSSYDINASKIMQTCRRLRSFYGKLASASLVRVQLLADVRGELDRDAIAIVAASVVTEIDHDDDVPVLAGAVTCCPNLGGSSRNCISATTTSGPSDSWQGVRCSRVS